MVDQYNLKRFVEAQDAIYNKCLSDFSAYKIAYNEIESGKKDKHWIWYVFPQYNGLVSNPSYNTEFYAIRSKDEALCYLEHPILGKRVIEMSEMLLNKEESMSQIFGTDEKKVMSCLTLFEAVQSDIMVFSLVLDQCFHGKRCERTLNYLS
tara:strand:- start:94 stop:546 length:453 start_codon:yes stop_codon:yes gene_type:complete